MFIVFIRCVFALYFFIVWIACSFPMRTSLVIAFIINPQERQSKSNSEDMYISVFNDLSEQSF